MVALRQDQSLLHVAFLEDQELPELAELRRQGLSALREATFKPGYVTDGASLSGITVSHQSLELPESQSLLSSLGRRAARGPVALNEEDSLQETQQPDASGEWFTAKFKCICPCALAGEVTRAFSPIAQPPTAPLSIADLSESLRQEMPQVAELLRDWNDPPSPMQSDQLAQHPDDFEIMWNTCEPSKAGPSGNSTLAHMILARRTSLQSISSSRKGKGPAQELLQPIGGGEVLAGSLRAVAKSTVGSTVVTPLSPEQSAERQRKKRRIDRQEQLKSDEMPGRILELLLPHTHPPPPPQALEYLPIAQSRVPDFQVISFVDIGRSKKAFPHMRVYWIVPIHGKVTVPNAEFDSLPSSATFAKRKPLKVSKSSDLVWTAHRIAQFWRDILQVRLQQSGLYGPIGLAVSGPKPDPFRPDLGQDEYVICGDHIRIYCDLEWALKVRKYLEYIRISDKEIAEDLKGLKGERLLKSARLVLISDVGEPLIVA